MRGAGLDVVTLLGLLILAGSVVKLGVVVDPSHYQVLHSALPGEFLPFRYAGSVGLRLLGIVAGLGVVYRREMCRRLLIGLSSFTIVAIYWKHPLHAFKSVAAALHGHLAAIAALLGVPVPTLEALYPIARVARIAVCVMDVAVAAFLIFFFTRRDISKQFR